MRRSAIVFYSTKLQVFLNGKQRGCGSGHRRSAYYSTVNVEKVASLLEMPISSHDFRISTTSCIFTTPTVLSRHNKAAYMPTAFSIGPLHHAKPDLKRTEIIKLKYLNGLVSRSQVNLRDLISAVAKLEGNAREHYGEPIKFGADELVKILVLDGCFLVELFRKNARVVPREKDDPVFTMSCLFQHLLHDLILLENQIPWVVLDRLFDLTESDREKRSLKDLAIEFLNEELPTESKHLHKLARNINGAPKSRHLLELLREILVVSTSPKQITTTDEEESWPPIPSATKLRRAGISFKKSKTGGLSISFRKGVLHVSPITITETTEALFRNIISFEQCSHSCPPIFTSYAILLDNLINTPEDLEYLVKQGIITNWLNPEDATRFFNKLYHDAFVNTFCYPKLCADVKGHYRRRLPKWKTLLVTNYFCNPWVGASTFAAILLVILTFVETVFTVLGYFKDDKSVDAHKEDKSVDHHDNIIDDQGDDESVDHHDNIIDDHRDDESVDDQTDDDQIKAAKAS